MRHLLAGLISLSCCLSLFSQSSPIQFRDASRELGLPVSNDLPAQKVYLVESVSGGIGLFDCDNDGRLDLIVVNDSTVDHYLHGGDPMVTLYHQEKDGKFVDITQSAGLTRRGWGMGLAVADYDNDGLLDLYVTGYGGNALYHNLGNCKFEDVTDKAGVAAGEMSTGAAWGDYDRDGKIDLFVSRYAHEDVRHLTPADKITERYKGLAIEAPWGKSGDTDLLFHNLGNGKFEEVAAKAGVDGPDKLLGLGVVWGDYDNDGWPDLFVANDSGPKYLYHNNHNGTFDEVGFATGVALGSSGLMPGSMGVDFGDFDRDGKLDLLVTNFADQVKELFHNEGAAGFQNIAESAKIAKSSIKWVGWGTGFADFDNDGFPDILMANGQIYPQLEGAEGEHYRQPILLYRNNGNRTFEEMATPAGLNEALHSRRGVAFGDINNDGNVDVVVFNVGGPPSIFLNETRNSNHRALFHLIGTKSNKAAIGARITVHAGKATLLEEIHGGSSYLSQNDLRAHFGLGSSTIMDTVEIAWPSGTHESFSNVAADAIYTIVEGEGKIKNKIALPAVVVKPETAATAK